MPSLPIRRWAYLPSGKAERIPMSVAEDQLHPPVILKIRCCPEYRVPSRYAPIEIEDYHLQPGTTSVSSMPAIRRAHASFGPMHVKVHRYPWKTAIWQHR